MHQSNFSLSTHASWQDVSWIYSLFYTFGILDERAASSATPFSLIFSSSQRRVRQRACVYLNELFLNMKDTLHVSRR